MSELAKKEGRKKREKRGLGPSVKDDDEERVWRKHEMWGGTMWLMALEIGGKLN